MKKQVAKTIGIVGLLEKFDTEDQAVYYIDGMVSTNGIESVFKGTTGRRLPYEWLMSAKMTKVLKV